MYKHICFIYHKIGKLNDMDFYERKKLTEEEYTRLIENLEGANTMNIHENAKWGIIRFALMKLRNPCFVTIAEMLLIRGVWRNGWKIMTRVCSVVLRVGRHSRGCYDVA
jgi:hypothetical protein